MVDNEPKLIIANNDLSFLYHCELNELEKLEKEIIHLIKHHKYNDIMEYHFQNLKNNGFTWSISPISFKNNENIIEMIFNLNIDMSSYDTSGWFNDTAIDGFSENQSDWVRLLGFKQENNYNINLSDININKVHSYELLWDDAQKGYIGQGLFDIHYYFIRQNKPSHSFYGLNSEGNREYWELKNGKFINKDDQIMEEWDDEIIDLSNLPSINN